jgi:hypothetical protein
MVGEEVVGFPVVSGIVDFFAVTCEEYGTATTAVAYADDVALLIGGGVGEGMEWIREVLLALGRRRSVYGTW